MLAAFSWLVTLRLQFVFNILMIHAGCQNETIYAIVFPGWIDSGMDVLMAINNGINSYSRKVTECGFQF